jgi:hypothetical protein
MQYSRRFVLTLLALSLITRTTAAEEARPPLQLMPGEIDLVVSVPKPLTLYQTVTSLEVLKKLEDFTAYRELIDSTNARRLRQFVAYFERQSNASREQLLDEVAGGGIYLGVKVGKDPAPSLLIVQGRHEKQVKEFARVAIGLFEQELARQDENAKPKRVKYRDVEILVAGDKLFAAVAGSAILVSNDEKTLHASLDLYRGATGKNRAEEVKEACKILPENPLATLWYSLESIKKDSLTAANFKPSTRNDPAQTILFGGYFDIVGRSSYVAAALVRERDDFVVTVRLPAGRSGMGPDSILHVPSSAASGSRPLLQPKGALFSTSFYLDIASIWNDRGKLFNEKVARNFEMADSTKNPFLANFKISKILPLVGTHHRFVAAVQPEAGYIAQGGFSIPAFAVVSELRDPDKFEKTASVALRGAAAVGGFQVRMKYVEEKIGDITLVGYRFKPEQPGVDEGVAGILKYYSPCFARVGDQFLLSSTIELGRELVGSLQNETKSNSSSAVSSRLFMSGAADYLQTIESQVVSGIVLDLAIPIPEATAQVRKALAMLRSIGPLDIEVKYDENRFSYDFRLKSLK